MTTTTPLAALATVFTAPSSCATSTWLFTTNKVPSQYPPLPTDGPDPSCDPPRWEDSMDERGYLFYSPAVCPDGFAVGVSCTSVQLKTNEGFPRVTAGETVAFCVPSGYTCTADTTDFRGGIWGMTQTATTPGAEVTVGPAMQIRWRDVDLPALQTHPLTPGLVVATLPGQQPAEPSQPPGRLMPVSPAPGPPPPPGTTMSTRNRPDVIVVPVPVPTPSTILFTTLSTSTRTPDSETRPTGSPFATPSSSSSSSSSSTGRSRAGDTTAAASRTSSSTSAASRTSGASNGDSAMIPSPSSLPVGPIILACLITLLILVLAAFFIVKRRKHQKDPNSGPMLPVGLGVWAGRTTKGTRRRRWLLAEGSRPQTRGIGSADEKSAAAAAGGMYDGSSGPPPPETGGNPAEPQVYGNGRESAADEQRWSWVSRMFSIRAGQDGQPGPMTDEEDEAGAGANSRRTTRSSRWTVWDPDGAVGEQQMNLSVPPVPVPVPAPVPMPMPMPSPALLAPHSGSFAGRRSAASVRTTRSTKTTKSLRIEAANRAAGQSAGHLSAFGIGAPPRSPMRSPFLVPDPSPDRLRRISDGTFGGYGNQSDDDSSDDRATSARTSPGP